MSNRLTQNPLVVDTTDTLVPGPLSINAIKWVATENSGKDIANADDLTICLAKTKIAGTVVIQCRAQLAAVTGSVIYSAEFGRPGWLVGPDGLYVEDIDGGELQIFLN